MSCIECQKAWFIVDYLYEALGSANDDIINMAFQAWEDQGVED